MLWWKGSRYWSCSGEGHAGGIVSNYHRTNDEKAILSSSPLRNDHLFKVWMWKSSTKRLHCSDLSSGGRKKKMISMWLKQLWRKERGQKACCIATPEGQTVKSCSRWAHDLYKQWHEGTYIPHSSTNASAVLSQGKQAPKPLVLKKQGPIRHPTRPKWD